MKLIRFAVRSLGDGFSYQLQKPQMIRAFSTNLASAHEINRNQNADTSESSDDFTMRIFDGASGGSFGPFYQRLDRAERAHGKFGSESNFNGGYSPSSSSLDGLHDSFSSSQDDMEGKLMDKASYFEWNPDEVDQDDYSFRPDMNFSPGVTYEPKDLDLKKPGVWMPNKRYEFQTTTKEVLSNADFRNVRFLANFLTEAGIMLKRSHTGISAKAQRKVAREIKTARAFGLLPFTTMGTKAFRFGTTMESLKGDYEYSSFENPATPDAPDADARGAF